MLNFNHLCCATLLLIGNLAHADSADHPLVGHYDGSEQVGRHINEFDEVELINGPIANARGIGAPGWMRVEGKVTLLYYTLPAGRSSLEVLRNYQSSLEGKGFRIAYTCATGNGSCYENRPGHLPNTGPYDFAEAFDTNPELPRLNSDFIRNYFRENVRYLLARLSRSQGVVYVAIVIAENSTRGNHAFIRVVETKDMDADRISFVTATQMRSALAEQGRISLYGIQFDFDKDSLRSESGNTLDEIAELLNGDKSLRLSIVGHTDNQGSEDYNLDLSRRRAGSVVAALVRDRGIDSSRLDARGAGASEPIVANDSDSNRAINRRVELIGK